MESENGLRLHPTISSDQMIVYPPSHEPDVGVIGKQPKDNDSIRVSFDFC